MREQDLIPHYNRHPDYWSPINKDSVHEIMRKLGVTLDSDSSVLDIGCGDGRLLRLLNDTYCVGGVGIDYPKVRIEKAKNLSDCDKIRFIHGSIHDDHKLDAYDYGFLFEVLEHLEQPQKALDRYKGFCNAIVGSVPLDMPYKAHLQVFESIADVEDRLNVNVIYTHGRQAYFRA